MVIGVTLATIYLLMHGGADGTVSVFFPDALREAVEDEVEDASLRARCLEICEELHQRVTSYDALVTETLEVYLGEVEDYWSTQVDLGSRLDPVAEAREATLLACLDARAQLVELLDASTWVAVFGELED